MLHRQPKKKNQSRQAMVAAAFIGLFILQGATYAADDMENDKQSTQAKSTKTEKQQTPVYESEKSWKFDKQKNIHFFNTNPNKDGNRYVHWKSFQWVITVTAITIKDASKHNITITSLRNQKIKDDKIQSDKDLMNDLKKQAKKVRKEKEKKHDSDVQMRVGVGVGVGFRF